MIRILKKIDRFYSKQHFLIRILITLLFFCFFIISTQNFQIFPGAVISAFSNYEGRGTPKDVEAHFIKTEDNKTIEVWSKNKGSKKVALIFHGNGGDISNFFAYQDYFSSIGYTTYAFDYRGYGKSSGWPSETGIYLDTDAVIKFILEKEQITSKNLNPCWHINRKRPCCLRSQ